MNRIIVVFILQLGLSVALIAQTTFQWPLLPRANSGANVMLINDNLGDYRRNDSLPNDWDLQRYHLGTDLQEQTPESSNGTDVFPVHSGEILHVGTSTHTGFTERWYVIQHGTMNTENQFVPLNPASYSVYLHGRSSLAPTRSTGDFVTETDVLFEGHDLYTNHLHFNIVSDLNGTTTDVNDDHAHNPMSEYLWEDANGFDMRPTDNTNPTNPFLHYLYLQLSHLTEIEVLDYPEYYSNLFSEDTPQGNYHRIEFNGENTNNVVYEKPRVLISNTNTSTMRLFAHATDQWNDTGLAPHSIKVFFDQYSEDHVTFGLPYFKYELNEIVSIQQNVRPHPELIYSTRAPLESEKENWREQYYKFFIDPENDPDPDNPNANLRPNAQLIYNDPIDLTSSSYAAEEGFHRIEIVMKSLPHRNFSNELVFDEKVAVLYYYILRNSDEYVDFSQSGNVP